MKRFDGQPFPFPLTHLVAPAYTSHEYPAPFDHELEPTGVESPIGHHDRPTPRWQNARQTAKEHAVDGGMAVAFLRMNLFVQCEAAPLHHDTRAQQMPALIGSQIRPVHHHQYLVDPT